MKPFLKSLTAVICLMLMGAATPNRLYVVVEDATGNVLQMGLHDYAVTVENAATQSLVQLPIEKPTNLSPQYFRVVDGKLVEMSIAEMDAVDAKSATKTADAEVERLKAIMARDPAGFRQVLGL